MKLIPKAVTDLFGKPASKDDPRKTEAALAAARALVADAARELALAEQDHERRAPDAMSAGDAELLDQLANAIGEARRQLEATAATCRAVEKRHEAALAAADAATIAAQWKAAREVAARRAEAGKRLQAAVEQLAVEFDAAVGLDNELLAALPVRPKSLPSAFGGSQLGVRALRWLGAKSPSAFGKHLGVDSPHRVLNGRSLADEFSDVGNYLMAGDPQRSNKEDAA
jgi:hypothetical protein